MVKKIFLSLLIAHCSLLASAQMLNLDLSLPVLPAPSLPDLELRGRYNAPLGEPIPGYDLWLLPELWLLPVKANISGYGAQLVLDGERFSPYLFCGELNKPAGCRVGLRIDF